MREGGKPLVWLHGEVKTPPLSMEARVHAGVLLRRLQQGEMLSLPASRPMPALDSRAHELRIADAGTEWRLVYRIDPDAIVIADVFKKKTQKTPKRVLDACEKRFKAYDAVSEE